jgi:hypothetical protein
MQRTHRNKPVRPDSTIVTNKPSTEASKPWPKHTVFPARSIRPLPAVGEEIPGYVAVGFKDEGESSRVVIKVFVIVGSDAWEKDGEVNEGEVVRGEIEIVEIVNGPGVVAVDVEISERDDDERSEEDDRTCLSSALSSWNKGLVPDRSLRTDSELNLKRPSL